MSLHAPGSAQAQAAAGTAQPTARKRGRPKKHPEAADAQAAQAQTLKPATLKSEVYEDLADRFEQVKAEREPKRHRGNPKGYQIKPYCKNPECGKMLPGGRCNKCPHCQFDLAQHRKDQHLERLLRMGELAPAAVKNLVRDAANEAHVRTGGKAIVLTLVYVDGATVAPAQAIVYGKPGLKFMEHQKDLLATFEATCQDHFKDLQQQAEMRKLAAQAAALVAQVPLLQAQSSSGYTAGLLSGTPGMLLSLPMHAGMPPGTAQQSMPASGVGAQLVPLDALAPPLDLEEILRDTLSEAEAAAAVEKCKSQKLDGKVLQQLPQALQLQLLVQAGLLAGEAARVMVEIEVRLRGPQQQMPMQVQAPVQMPTQTAVPSSSSPAQATTPVQASAAVAEPAAAPGGAGAPAAQVQAPAQAPTAAPAAAPVGVPTQPPADAALPLSSLPAA